MPTAATHSFFWAGSADLPPAATTVIVGYVPWQTTVIIGGLFGVTQVGWEWLCDRLERRAEQNKGRA